MVSEICENSTEKIMCIREFCMNSKERYCILKNPERDGDNCLHYEGCNERFTFEDENLQRNSQNIEPKKKDEIATFRRIHLFFPLVRYVVLVCLLDSKDA